MKRKYNWTQIQKAYDNGLSTAQLYEQMGISPRAFQLAKARGEFNPRNRSDAGNLHHKDREPTKHTAEFKDRQRHNIIHRYENGWEPKAGRCKKFVYVSPIAGNVKLDGTWELAVAKWLDNQNYNWKRNTKRFQYINLKGAISHYTPDFWVEELNGYLEVKGYETELDRCKWGQFLEPLTIWKKSTLVEMKII